MKQTIEQFCQDPVLRAQLAQVQRDCPKPMERTKQALNRARPENSTSGLIARIIRLEHEAQMAREELDLYRPLVIKLAEMLNHPSPARGERK